MRRLLSLAALAGGLAAGEGGAQAAFFGLFGDDPPTPNPQTIPYAITFHATGAAADDGGDPEQALKDASSAYRLRDDPPPDGEALARRAAADYPALVDALWALGYYNAEVRIAVAGVPLPIGTNGAPAAAARAAEAFRARALAQITIDVALGPLFHVRGLSVDAPPAAAQALTPRVVGIKPGDPARASDFRAAEARMVDALRDRSYPFAKADEPSAVVDHAANAVDVAYFLTPGPLAGIGPVTVSGTQDVPPDVVRSFIYLEYGEPYSPKKIADTRKSIATIPAIAGARAREGTALDANGELPVDFAVSERPKNALGVSARYSTIDGPQLHPYYENRNLFGGAERLRLDAETFLVPRFFGPHLKTFRDLRLSDIGTRESLSFMKPALFGSRNDLLFDVVNERNRIGTYDFGGYVDHDFTATLAIRHRFTQTFSAQAGVLGDVVQSDDALGRVNGRLIGLPLSVAYDSTDDPLNPTTGIKAKAGLTPYFSLNQNESFTLSKASLSSYYAIDEDAKYVVAGRITAGSLFGATLTDVPDTLRFFAGGSDTVRGFAYRTLAPTFDGKIVGGKSLLAGNLETRISITRTIQIVPFIDAGAAYASSFPLDLRPGVGVGAGVGLRYLTPIGPLRIDLATPVNPRHGDARVALYLGIGQDF